MNAYLTAPFRIFGTVSLSGVTSSTSVALSRAQNQTCVITVETGNTTTAFIKFGNSAVTAAGTDFPVLPGTVQSFTLTADQTHVAAFSSASATLYASVGEGV